MVDKKSKKVLLIIEDNPLLVGIYKTAFEKVDIAVKVAHNGEDGVELAKAGGVDMALVDLLMHGMDGFDVIKALKGDAKTEEIKVVILTSISNKESKKKAIASGAEDYLIKSELELNEIVEKVMKYFN